MFDELQRLRQSHGLFRLLDHYARLGQAAREAWQDRLMDLDGVPSPQLVRLHGELLAYGWLEQNTGCTPALQPGAVPRCYRITPAGLRALRRARTERDADEDGDPEAAEAAGQPA